MYKHISQNFQKGYSEKKINGPYKSRLLVWRRNRSTIIRLDKPTNVARARSLGYKAKKGFVIALSKVGKGGRYKPRPKAGRRPKRMGVKKYTPSKSIQLIAEERAARKFKNLEVLNSYWVGDDGLKEYYEVIFFDPAAPEIQSDKNLNFSQKRRVHRGLTSAGKKARGLKTRKGKGKGTERNRPSIRAKRGRGK
jgi:large subunit ribosomal protein L15e